MKKYYYKVAKFIIEVLLDNQPNKKLKNMLFNCLSEFSIDKRDNSTDLYLELKNRYESEYVLMNNKVFLKLYEREKPNKFISSAKINPEHLQLLLKNAIKYAMKRHKDFLFHASACLIDNKAVLFTGESASGKSTIVKLLSKNYRPLCDDLAIIRKENNGYVVYQTPYKEKNRYSKSSQGYIIDSLYFVHRSNYFRIKPLDVMRNVSYITYLSKQMYIDADRKAIMRFIFWLENKIYDIYFPKQGNAKLYDYFEVI
jgi:hypothetical protein